MDPRDQSSWRRLPDPGEPPQAGAGPGGRDRGIRRVQRMSNAIAAGLVVATAVTAGYFARASGSTGQPASPAPGVPGAGVPGTGTAGTGAAVTGTQPGTPGVSQPCVTVPVATSGGSGVAAPAPATTCVPAAPGTPGGTSPGGTSPGGTSPGGGYVQQGERED